MHIIFLNDLTFDAKQHIYSQFESNQKAIFDTKVVRQLPFINCIYIVEGKRDFLCLNIIDLS